ncbi:MAG: hypothetical protein J6V58_01355 [Clostridia bacterium]|nr:hypothetical protein [Clostridia bacterium]
MLYVIISIILTIIVYRLGVMDGQKRYKGEKISLIPNAKNNEIEVDKFQKGIKNILNYNTGVNN